MNFGEPAALSSPGTVIIGAVPGLIGTWSRTGCTGTCQRFVIERAQDGRTIIGHLLYENVALSGPFAPPTDPNVGYPTELPSSEYQQLIDGAANVAYPVLDGVYDGQTLTFWYSTVDIWTNWCRMQTAYRIQVNGKAKYRCVPDGADASNTDLGKLALCADASDGPYCPAIDGSDQPCACLDAAGRFAGGPQCTTAYCQCDARGCASALHAGGGAHTLRVEGGQMTEVSPSYRYERTTP